MRRMARPLLLLGVVVLCGLFFADAARAAWYAGNTRTLGAGVKAAIATPSQNPAIPSGVIANYVSNVDTHDGGKDWLQVGWVDGDGSWTAANGVTPPTVPSSYREVNIDAYYDFDVYSAQPYNYARTYEVVNIGSNFQGEYWWRSIIADGNRGDYWGFANKSPVVGLSEMQGSSQNQCMASFSNVQYKGDYPYMYFDQNNAFAEFPLTLNLVYYYRYDTHANGL